MYVVAIHSITDPDKFWSGPPDKMPEGTSLPTFAGNSDGTRAICIWKTDSVDTVQNLVEDTYGAISTNEFFAVDENVAQGLPN